MAFVNRYPVLYERRSCVRVVVHFDRVTVTLVILSEAKNLSSSVRAERFFGLRPQNDKNLQVTVETQHGSRTITSVRLGLTLPGRTA